MKPGIYKTWFLGEEIPVRYVANASEADTLLSRLLDQEIDLIGIDTETMRLPQYAHIRDAALSPHLSTLRLIQIYTGRTAIVFDWLKLDCDYLKTRFRKLFESKRFVAHNAVFDLQYFYKYFGIKHMNIGCTYLAAKLIMHAKRPTDAGLYASLKSLVDSVFKTEIFKETAVSDWAIPELTWEQVEYSALDAVCTYKLWERFKTKLKALEMQRVYKLYRDAQHPVVKLQLNGIKLDVDEHRDRIVEWRTDLYKAKKNLCQITSLVKITGHTIADYLEKKLDSATLQLWPRTETGKLATDAHVFADFDYLDIVKPFHEFQKKAKLCTSFGNSLINLINLETGRIHSQYKLAGARTGRMSCSKPNLTQIPRDKSVRSLFIPEVRNHFLCADYSQIEIRVGAELSQDHVMLQAYRQGVDLHALTAANIARKLIEDVTQEERQAAKAFNFGLMYGLGSKNFGKYAKQLYGVEVSHSEAIKGVETWRDTYNDYYSYQMRRADIARETLQTRTPCGKLRRLDAENYFGASQNTGPQGGAAECMLYALVRLNNFLTKTNAISKIVNVVHDEIVVETCEEESMPVSRAIEDSMVQGFLDVFPEGITDNLVHIGCGETWAEAKE